jgi:sugar/nucleoside kinase (ribokinase family)
MIFGTLAQRTPAGLAAWREAIAATRATKVCDLNLRPTDQNAPAIAEAIDAADIIKINDRELAALHQWFGWRDPIAKLRERSKLVAVTHGAAGSTLHGEHTIDVAAFAAAPGGDNVGCGDAYLALLVYGLTSGWDLETSGRVAARWSAAVAGARGATPTFSDELIEELLA